MEKGFGRDINKIRIVEKGALYHFLAQKGLQWNIDMQTEAQGNQTTEAPRWMHRQSLARAPSCSRTDFGSFRPCQEDLGRH